MKELIKELETIIYKLVRERELSEQDKEIIDNIIENKDYGTPISQ